ncbi:hypothetical protein ACQW02_12990 [Humitalea sp. 24SJ18S-53]|uniref:hypothetical protein n=1 Tax=Humitalea sp. 24SJ18S-53 TaxID=3422307 RepID=UPI003D671C37
MTDAEIAQAAAILAAARQGNTIAGLPDHLRPQTLRQAEAIQLATLAALGLTRGGWKLGRLGTHLFSAPMPVGPLGEAEPVIVLPPGSRIELELALRFRADLQPGRAPELSVLPAFADLVVLIEFVRTRFTVPAATTELERIADCIANEQTVAVVMERSWQPEILESLPAVRLLQDGQEIAHHSGRHTAAPLAPLFDAWRQRCMDGSIVVGAGEIVTLGSLTGVLPIPAEGARFTGEIVGLPTLHCLVAPISEIRA